ncbi:MAG: HesA/MoeB/ThiF family protein [Eubacteriales bacterium]
MSIETRYRLRPSVSLVPTKHPFVWEFFQSNTRRIRHIKVIDNNLIEIVKNLNGESIQSIFEKYNSDKSNIQNFIYYLYDQCYIEDLELAQKINSDPFNRVINFIADYYPTHEAINAFNKLQNSKVLIVGLGAVGSWVAHLLTQNGVTNFVLCDPDIINTGNLNRSLFYYDDVGKFKTTCVKEHIRHINPFTYITCFNSLIEKSEDIINIIDNSYTSLDLVINCADFPNVDTTSEYIAKACMKKNIPHIISGGYNLHLSLIGPSIIPYSTPCYFCIKKGLEQANPPEFKNIKKLSRKRRNLGNISPITGISSAFTTFEAFRVLIASDRIWPLMAGRRGEFNFLTSELNYSEYPKLEYCDWCGCVYS